MGVAYVLGISHGEAWIHDDEDAASSCVTFTVI